MKKKLRLRVEDLNLLEMKQRSASSREEEEVDAQSGPCGKAIGNKTHVGVECEVYKGV